jgi:hypothetical protein
MNDKELQPHNSCHDTSPSNTNRLIQGIGVCDMSDPPHGHSNGHSNGHGHGHVPDVAPGLNFEHDNVIVADFMRPIPLPGTRSP